MFLNFFRRKGSNLLKEIHEPFRRRTCLNVLKSFVEPFRRKGPTNWKSEQRDHRQPRVAPCLLRGCLALHARSLFHLFTSKPLAAPYSPESNSPLPFICRRITRRIMGKDMFVAVAAAHRNAVSRHEPDRGDRVPWRGRFGCTSDESNHPAAQNLEMI